MPLDPNINTREFLKFGLTSSGLHAVRVLLEDALTPSLPPGWSRVNYFNKISAVGSGSQVLVGSYTAPPSTDSYLFGIGLHGTNKAIYTVKLDGTQIDELVTYFTELNGDLSFGPYGMLLSSGQLIEVYVEHVRSDPGDFSVKLIGLEHAL